MFTTALIAGDAVILDALAQLKLLDKVPVVFVDTYTLFPESLAHIQEVENHYGFKSKVYAAAGVKDVDEYHAKYGRDYWMKVRLALIPSRLPCLNSPCFIVFFLGYRCL